MSFGEAIKSVFSKYAVFSGRARRSEFWYFVLFYLLVDFALGCIPFLGALSVVWSLAILIPSIAVTVRRFHDIGKSGWNYLIILIPELFLLGYMFRFILFVIKDLIDAGINFYNFSDNIEVVWNCIVANNSLATLGVLLIVDLAATILGLIWMTKDSQPGENQWGPNPKEQAEASYTNRNQL